MTVRSQRRRSLFQLQEEVAHRVITQHQPIGLAGSIESRCSPKGQADRSGGRSIEKYRIDPAFLIDLNAFLIDFA